MSDPILDYWRPADASHAWGPRQVLHLHRRAAFGATRSELKRDIADGMEVSVNRMLDGSAGVERSPDDFHDFANLLRDTAVGSKHVNRLKAWWLYRMLFTPDPLREKLTLLWHNHFATSNHKVRNLDLMCRQNELFRRHALGSFGDLLGNVLRDPAMLIWMDADSNVQSTPNENLAREAMELFSLGIGNYDESDVKEAARALTGWSVQENQSRFNKDRFDGNTKTLLGRTGPLDANDVHQLLIDHPATARRIAWRLCDLLMGEATVSDPGLGELVSGLKTTQLDLRWAVETILRSQRFYAAENIGNRVLAPIDFVVGAVRVLEVHPTPSTLLMADFAAGMGQDLFCPPNVFGWPGGRDWLNSRTMLSRMKFAAALTTGGLQSTHAASQTFKALEELPAADALALLAQLILGRETIPESIRIEANESPVYRVICSPQAQLG